MRTLLTLFILSLFFAVSLSGCGGSNGPVTVDAPAGNGYRVSLTSSAETVTPGGTVQLTAVVFAPDNSVVLSDEDGVSFVANLPGNFSDTKVKISNGTALTTFTWSDNSSSDNPAPSRVLKLTASFRGAATTAELTAVSRSF